MSHRLRQGHAPAIIPRHGRGSARTHLSASGNDLDRYRAPWHLAAHGSVEVYQPGAIFGSYRLLRLIAVGGMGHVYLAEHISLGRHVALKMLRPTYTRDRQAVARFFAEARAVNHFHHENIVEITDFVEEPSGQIYYIMELLAGSTLAEVLAHGCLPVERSISIALQICDALAAVHQAGIVHRDLKPGNVFLTTRAGRLDYVKLLDFGVAKLCAPLLGDVVGDTNPGSILGTPVYMSPQQAAGQEVDHRTDIYAFGTILYEMLAGHPPFVSKDVHSLLEAHRAASPVPLSALGSLPRPVPPALDGLVMRCLAKDPADRPQSMAEIADVLRRIETSESAVTITRNLGPVSHKRRLLRALLHTRYGGWPALVTIACLIGAIVALASMQCSESPTLPPARWPKTTTSTPPAAPPSPPPQMIAEPLRPGEGRTPGPSRAVELAAPSSGGTPALKPALPPPRSKARARSIPRQGPDR